MMIMILTIPQIVSESGEEEGDADRQARLRKCEENAHKLTLKFRGEAAPIHSPLSAQTHTTCLLRQNASPRPP